MKRKKSAIFEFIFAEGGQAHSGYPAPSAHCHPERSEGSPSAEFRAEDPSLRSG